MSEYNESHKRTADAYMLGYQEGYADGCTHGAVCVNVHENANENGNNGACVFECSECGFSLDTTSQDFTNNGMVECEADGARTALFFRCCPNCGATIID